MADSALYRKSDDQKLIFNYTTADGRLKFTRRNHTTVFLAADETEWRKPGKTVAQVAADLQPYGAVVLFRTQDQAHAHATASKQRLQVKQT